MNEVAKGFLEELGSDLGIEGLEFDEYGYCCLEFPDQTINIEADESGLIFLYAHLGNVPKEKTEAFFAMLLEANYLWQQTGGGCLGVDREADVVLLAMQSHVAALDGQGFKNMMENFLNTSVTWTRRVEGFPGQAGPAGRESEGMQPQPGMRV